MTLLMRESWLIDVLRAYGPESGRGLMTSWGSARCWVGWFSCVRIIVVSPNQTAVYSVCRWVALCFTACVCVCVCLCLHRPVRYRLRPSVCLSVCLCLCWCVFLLSLLSDRSLTSSLTQWCTHYNGVQASYLLASSSVPPSFSLTMNTLQRGPQWPDMCPVCTNCLQWCTAVY